MHQTSAIVPLRPLPRPSVLLVLGALVVLTAAPMWAQTGIAATPVTNLRTAIFTSLDLDGDLLPFLAHENHQGMTDLNSDGDAIDAVLHVYDFVSGTTKNLGLASVGDPIVASGLVFFEVPEITQGNSDLNGDGDTGDGVLHMYDAATGTVTNFGLAIAGIPHLDGKLLAFIVDESDQNNTDLNGDGDTGDNVVFTYNHATGVMANHAIAALSSPFPHGKFVQISVSEPAQAGTDLNGDGDTTDAVLHVLNAATGAITNVGLHVLTAQINRTMISFWVFEPSQGASDLNGDGDSSDRVMHIFDLATSTTINTGLAVNVGSLLEGTRVAFKVRENEQGTTDLNGDGDTNDTILHVFDLAGAGTVNLGLAVGVMDFTGARLGMGVIESSQASTDLNGDGDTSDQVIHIYDAATGSLLNLGLATGILVMDGRTTAFEVSESGQGGTDLNGDGDATDLVLHVHQAGAVAPVNVGLALAGSPLVDGGVVLFPVYEAGQAGLDRNGDADALDSVLAAYKATTGATKNLGLAVGFGVHLQKNRAAIPVIEADQGASDLNSDGDTLDLVLHVSKALF